MKTIMRLSVQGLGFKAVGPSVGLRFRASGSGHEGPRRGDDSGQAGARFRKLLLTPETKESLNPIHPST